MYNGYKEPASCYSNQPVFENSGQPAFISEEEKQTSAPPWEFSSQSFKNVSSYSGDQHFNSRPTPIINNSQVVSQFNNKKDNSLNLHDSNSVLNYSTNNNNNLHQSVVRPTALINCQTNCNACRSHAGRVPHHWKPPVESTRYLENHSVLKDHASFPASNIPNYVHGNSGFAEDFASSLNKLSRYSREVTNQSHASVVNTPAKKDLTSPISNCVVRTGGSLGHEGITVKKDPCHEGCRTSCRLFKNKVPGKFSSHEMTIQNPPQNVTSAQRENVGSYVEHSPLSNTGISSSCAQWSPNTISQSGLWLQNSNSGFWMPHDDPRMQNGFWGDRNVDVMPSGTVQSLPPPPSYQEVTKYKAQMMSQQEATRLRDVDLGKLLRHQEVQKRRVSNRFVDPARLHEVHRKVQHESSKVQDMARYQDLPQPTIARPQDSRNEYLNLGFDLAASEDVQGPSKTVDGSMNSLHPSFPGMEQELGRRYPDPVLSGPHSFTSNTADNFPPYHNNFTTGIAQPPSRFDSHLTYTQSKITRSNNYVRYSQPSIDTYTPNNDTALGSLAVPTCRVTTSTNSTMNPVLHSQYLAEKEADINFMLAPNNNVIRYNTSKVAGSEIPFSNLQPCNKMSDNIAYGKTMQMVDNCTPGNKLNTEDSNPYLYNKPLQNASNLYSTSLKNVPTNSYPYQSFPERRPGNIPYNAYCDNTSSHTNFSPLHSAYEDNTMSMHMQTSPNVSTPDRALRSLEIANASPEPQSRLTERQVTERTFSNEHQDSVGRPIKKRKRRMKGPGRQERSSSESPKRQSVIPILDVRQFLATWDEGTEDMATSKTPDVVLANNTDPLIVLECDSLTLERSAESGLIQVYQQFETEGLPPNHASGGNSSPESRSTNRTTNVYESEEQSNGPFNSHHSQNPMLLDCQTPRTINTITNLQPYALRSVHSPLEKPRKQNTEVDLSNIPSSQKRHGTKNSSNCNGITHDTLEQNTIVEKNSKIASSESEECLENDISEKTIDQQNIIVESNTCIKPILEEVEDSVGNVDSVDKVMKKEDTEGCENSSHEGLVEQTLLEEQVRNKSNLNHGALKNALQESCSRDSLGDKIGDCQKMSRNKAHESECSPRCNSTSDSKDSYQATSALPLPKAKNVVKNFNVSSLEDSMFQAQELSNETSNSLSSTECLNGSDHNKRTRENSASTLSQLSEAKKAVYQSDEDNDLVKHTIEGVVDICNEKKTAISQEQFNCIDNEARNLEVTQPLKLSLDENSIHLHEENDQISNEAVIKQDTEFENDVDDPKQSLLPLCIGPGTEKIHDCSTMQSKSFDNLRNSKENVRLSIIKQAHGNVVTSKTETHSNVMDSVILDQTSKEGLSAYSKSEIQRLALQTDIELLSIVKTRSFDLRKYRRIKVKTTTPDSLSSNPQVIKNLHICSPDPDDCLLNKQTNTSQVNETDRTSSPNTPSSSEQTDKSFMVTQDFYELQEESRPFKNVQVHENEMEDGSECLESINSPEAINLTIPSLPSQESNVTCEMHSSHSVPSLTPLVLHTSIIKHVASLKELCNIVIQMGKDFTSTESELGNVKKTIHHFHEKLTTNCNTSSSSSHLPPSKLIKPQILTKLNSGNDLNYLNPDSLKPNQPASSNETSMKYVITLQENYHNINCKEIQLMEKDKTSPENNFIGATCIITNKRTTIEETRANKACSEVDKSTGVTQDKIKFNDGQHVSPVLTNIDNSSSYELGHYKCENGSGDTKIITHSQSATVEYERNRKYISSTCKISDMTEKKTEVKEFKRTQKQSQVLFPDIVNDQNCQQSSPSFILNACLKEAHKENVEKSEIVKVSPLGKLDLNDDRNSPNLLPSFIQGKLNNTTTKTNNSSSPLDEATPSKSALSSNTQSKEEEVEISSHAKETRNSTSNPIHSNISIADGHIDQQITELETVEQDLKEVDCVMNTCDLQSNFSGRNGVQDSLAELENGVQNSTVNDEKSVTLEEYFIPNNEDARPLSFTQTTDVKFRDRDSQMDCGITSGDFQEHLNQNIMSKLTQTTQVEGTNQDSKVNCEKNIVLGEFLIENNEGKEMSFENVCGTSKSCKSNTIEHMHDLQDVKLDFKLHPKENSTKALIVTEDKTSKSNIPSTTKQSAHEKYGVLFKEIQSNNGLDHCAALKETIDVGNDNQMDDFDLETEIMFIDKNAVVETNAIHEDIKILKYGQAKVDEMSLSQELLLEDHNNKTNNVNNVLEETNEGKPAKIKNALLPNKAEHVNIVQKNTEVVSERNEATNKEVEKSITTHLNYDEPEMGIITRLKTNSAESDSISQEDCTILKFNKSLTFGESTHNDDMSECWQAHSEQVIELFSEATKSINNEPNSTYDNETSQQVSNVMNDSGTMCANGTLDQKVSAVLNGSSTMCGSETLEQVATVANDSSTMCVSETLEQEVSTVIDSSTMCVNETLEQEVSTVINDFSIMFANETLEQVSTVIDSSTICVNETLEQEVSTLVNDSGRMYVSETLEQDVSTLVNDSSRMCVSETLEQEVSTVIESSTMHVNETLEQEVSTVVNDSGRMCVSETLEQVSTIIDSSTICVNETLEQEVSTLVNDSGRMCVSATLEQDVSTLVNDSSIMCVSETLEQEVSTVIDSSTMCVNETLEQEVSTVINDSSIMCVNETLEQVSTIIDSSTICDNETLEQEVLTDINEPNSTFVNGTSEQKVLNVINNSGLMCVNETLEQEVSTAINLSSTCVNETLEQEVSNDNNDSSTMCVNVTLEQEVTNVIIDPGSSCGNETLEQEVSVIIEPSSTYVNEALGRKVSNVINDPSSKCVNETLEQEVLTVINDSSSTYVSETLKLEVSNVLNDTSSTCVNKTEQEVSNEDDNMVEIAIETEMPLLEVTSDVLPDYVDSPEMPCLHPVPEVLDNTVRYPKTRLLHSPLNPEVPLLCSANIVTSSPNPEHDEIDPKVAFFGSDVDILPLDPILSDSRCLEVGSESEGLLSPSQSFPSKLWLTESHDLLLNDNHEIVPADSVLNWPYLEEEVLSEVPTAQSNSSPSQTVDTTCSRKEINVPLLYSSSDINLYQDTDRNYLNSLPEMPSANNSVCSEITRDECQLPFIQPKINGTKCESHKPSVGLKCCLSWNRIFALSKIDECKKSKTMNDKKSRREICRGWPYYGSPTYRLKQMGWGGKKQDMLDKEENRVPSLLDIHSLPLDDTWQVMDGENNNVVNPEANARTKQTGRDHMPMVLVKKLVLKRSISNDDEENIKGAELTESTKSPAIQNAFPSTPSEHVKIHNRKTSHAKYTPLNVETEKIHTTVSKNSSNGGVKKGKNQSNQRESETETPKGFREPYKSGKSKSCRSRSVSSARSPRSSGNESCDSGSGKQRLPRVIIRRTGSTRYTSCLQESGSGRWQPVVRLKRSSFLDNLARSVLRHGIITQPIRLDKLRLVIRKAGADTWRPLTNLCEYVVLENHTKETTLTFQRHKIQSQQENHVKHVKHDEMHHKCSQESKSSEEKIVNIDNTKLTSPTKNQPGASYSSLNPSRAVTNSSLLDNSCDKSPHKTVVNVQKCSNEKSDERSLQKKTMEIFDKVFANAQKHHIEKQCHDVKSSSSHVRCNDARNHKNHIASDIHEKNNSHIEDPGNKQLEEVVISKLETKDRTDTNATFHKNAIQKTEVNLLVNHSKELSDSNQLTPKKRSADKMNDTTQNSPQKKDGLPKKKKKKHKTEEERDEIYSYCKLSKTPPAEDTKNDLGRKEVKDDHLKCKKNCISSVVEGSDEVRDSSEQGCATCGVCSHVFKDVAERTLHIRQHPYHCQRCHLAFKSEVEFVEHLTSQHPRTREQHHCLLCERSFPSSTRHQLHLSGRQHRHLELSQRRTIHTLFGLFSGQHCPVLAPLSDTELAGLDWFPSQPGAIHFYHQATPLQLAVQDLVWRRRELNRDSSVEGQNTQDSIR